MTEHQDSADPGLTDRKAKRRGAVIVSGVALAAAAFGVYAAATHKSDATSVTEAEAPSGQVVTVVRANTRPFNRVVAVSGEARPRNDLRVFSPTTGVRVLSFLVEQGETVRRGQPLARLETSVVEAQLNSARAAVLEAEVEQARTESEYKRAESIKDSGALSVEALEQRQADARTAAARLDSARATLAEQNARLQGGYIRAPVSGLVIERPARLGELVDGQTLFRIAGDNQLEVAASVAEADMLELKVGQKAVLRMIDSTPVTATLRRPPAAIDSETRSGEALFDLPQDPRLRSGMFLRGMVELAPKDAIAVPQTAIQYNGAEAFVYVVGDDNIARRTVVTVGDREGAFVAIAAGLEVGARVAAGGAAFLQDGDRVRPVEAETSAGGEASVPRLGG